MAKVALKTSDQTFIANAIPHLNAGNNIVFWLNPNYISLNHPNDPRQLKVGDPGTIYAYSHSRNGIGIHDVEVVDVVVDSVDNLYRNYTYQALGTKQTGNLQDFILQLNVTLNQATSTNMVSINANTLIPCIILKKRNNGIHIRSTKPVTQRWSIDIILP